jgi:hypothetical protein
MTQTTVADAEREAEDARAAVADAEQDIKTGKRKVTASRLVAILGRRQHAELAAQEARERAERDREDARRQALKELGAEIDAAAADAGTDIADALGEVTAASARARARAAAWDARVAELIAAAQALGARGTVPGGIRRADEGVAVAKETVRHESTVLVSAGPQLGSALSYAIAGDLVSARAAVRLTQTVPLPQRSSRYFRGAGGQIIPDTGMVDRETGEIGENWLRQISGDPRTGTPPTLVELSESQVLQYLDGEQV